MNWVASEPKLCVQVVAGNQNNLDTLVIQALFIPKDLQAIEFIQAVHASRALVYNLRNLVFYVFLWLEELVPVFVSALVEGNHLLVLRVVLLSVHAHDVLDVPGVVFEFMV